MTKLIINADDFGLSKGVNHGIVDCYRYGLCKSTTLMVNMPAARHAANLAKEVPGLQVGLHLNISAGSALTQGNSIQTSEHQFQKLSAWEQPFVEAEVYAEFRAQFQLFIDLMGKRPTHFDSHLLVSDVDPIVRKVALRLAHEEQLPLRNAKVEKIPEVRFLWYKNVGVAYHEQIGLSYLYEAIDEIKKHEFVEVMVHPAYLDSYLMKHSSWNVMRLKDFDDVVSDELKRFLEEQGIEVIDYSQIMDEKYVK